MALGASLWALVGLAVGYLVSVLASRLPDRRPLTRWPPRCHAGHEPLSPREWAPLLGYLSQRGRCRHCGAALDARYPAVEALCAVSFGLLWWRFGASLETGIGSLYAAVLWLVFLIDWQHHLILNRVTYPSALVALALAFVYPRTDPLASLLGALVCGGAFLGLYLFGRLLYRGRVPLGLGDVKLAVVLGAMLGLTGGVTALFFGIVAGALQAVVLLLLGFRRRTYMPYGTALVFGAVAALLGGNEAWHWYMGG